METLSIESLIYLASSSATPLEILRELSKSENESVLKEVARNKNTPIEVLERLSESKLDNVRITIAYNRNTPSHILDVLSKDRNENVIEEVAKNPNTPIDVLRELSKCSIPSIVFAVARNIKAPLDVLYKLKCDNDGFFSTGEDKRRIDNKIFNRIQEMCEKNMDVSCSTEILGVNECKQGAIVKVGVPKECTYKIVSDDYMVCLLFVNKKQLGIV